MSTDAPPFLTPDDFAQRFGLPASSVREKCRRGEIKTVRWGRKYLIPPVEVARFAGDAPPAHDDGHDAEVKHRGELIRELRRLHAETARVLAELGE